MISLPQGQSSDFIDHSCDPNCGMRDSITMVAMRDIPIGEEVTFDYAMTDGSPYDEFECHCGAALCRSRVTGDDWRRPELWQRYQGYFSPYLVARINKEKQRKIELELDSSTFTDTLAI